MSTGALVCTFTGVWAVEISFAALIIILGGAP